MKLIKSISIYLLVFLSTTQAQSMVSDKIMEACAQLQAGAREVTVHDIIDCQGAQLIAQYLKGNQLTDILGVQHCGLGNEGSQTIINALQYTNITTLNLTNNCITYLNWEGPAVSSILPSSNLTEINFDNNSLGDYGACVLAKDLRQNCRLERLMLSGNSLTDAGVKLMKPYLMNSQIRVLDLSHNAIGQEGALALLHLAKSNTLLTDVKIDHNRSILTHTIEQLHDALQCNIDLINRRSSEEEQFSGKRHKNSAETTTDMEI